MSYARPPEDASPGRLLRVQAVLSGYVLCAVILGAVAGCWSPALGFFLLLGGLVLPVALLLLGLVTAMGVVRRRARKMPLRRRLALAGVALLSSAVSLLLLLPSLRLGVFLGNETLLLAYHRQYRTIIAEVARLPARSGAASGLLTRGSVRYKVDYGEPRRVAFEPSGFLDNWSGIVWDPTGAVERADGHDPATGRYRAPPGVTKLFGGDLVRCHRLWPEWYDCRFT